MSEKCQQATSITDGGSVSGDRKLKESTPRLARGRPQPAPVGIDDRPADRQPHTHAAGFGGEEGVEQPVRILGGDPDAAIRHTYEHLVWAKVSDDRKRRRKSENSQATNPNNRTAAKQRIESGCRSRHWVDLRHSKESEQRRKRANKWRNLPRSTKTINIAIDLRD
jgi:hypothetical protein